MRHTSQNGANANTARAVASTTRPPNKAGRRLRPAAFGEILFLSRYLLCVWRDVRTSRGLLLWGADLALGVEAGRRQRRAGGHRTGRTDPRRRPLAGL